MGGQSPQVIRLVDSSLRTQCDVPPKSELESQVLRLLKSALITDQPNPKDVLSFPSPRLLQWLVARIENRSLDWRSPRDD